MPRDLLSHPEPTKTKLDLIARTVCLRAAEIVEERGLARGVFSESKNGPVCLVGAIMAALELPWPQPNLIDIVLPFCMRLGFDNIGAVFVWSDAPGRTKEEVAQRLRIGGA